MPKAIVSKPCTCPDLGFTIGADPEFALKACGFDVSAGEFLKSVYGEAFNRDKMGVDLPCGNLGHDGCPTTGEMRPNAGSTPSDLADNIQSLLQALSDRSCGLVEASTQSVNAPIGGHIHLSLPASLKRGEGRSPCADEAKLQRVLSKVLTCFAPVLASTSKETLKRRDGNGSYGVLYDHRIHQPNRDTLTVEVRAPSAEWMTTRKTTESTLAFIAAVYHEALYHPESFKEYLKGLCPRVLQDVEKFRMINESSPRLFELFKRDVFRAIKHFGMYPKYQKEIDYLENPKAVLADKESVGFDALKGWEIVPKASTEVASNRVAETLLPNVMSSRRGYFADDDGIDACRRLIFREAIRTKKAIGKFPLYVFGLSEANARICDGAYCARATMRPCTGTRGTTLEHLTEGSAHANAEWQKDFANRVLGRIGGYKAIILGIPYAWRCGEEAIKAHETDILTVSKLLFT